MEKIITQGIVSTIPIYGEIHRFVSFNGKTYEKEEDCIRQDFIFKSLERMKAFKQKEIEIGDKSISCLFINTEDDLSFILDYYDIPNYKHKYQNVSVVYKSYPQVNQWIGIGFLDGGDYPDTHYVYSQDSLQFEVKKYIDSTKFLMEDL